MGKAVFRATARSARRSGGGALSSPGRVIQRVLLDEFRRDGPVLTRIFRNFAPHGKTGQTGDSVSASQTSRGGRVGITVLSTGAFGEDGYNYFDVTRFGRGAIVPKTKKALAFDGIVVRSVKAWKPAFDWVANAAAAANQEMDSAASRIGRQIQTRVL